MTPTHTINASGKKFGRVASEAAKALMGKNRADYTPNKQTDVRVEITNAAQLEIAEIKRSDIIYKRYSGYPGGQREETLGALSARRGIATALKKTIGGMLPKNTMWKGRMKRLSVKE
ncbi:MAG: uL13 family ribosomal protein [Parcubacteria group bacterium]|nr:uL13 family ribosomal protein [Parcubacteria group bacterium]